MKDGGIRPLGDRALQGGIRACSALLIILAATLAACASQGDSATTMATAPSTTTVRPVTTSTTITTSNGPAYALGAFPEFPSGLLPESMSNGLQAVLDATIADGTFTGIAAAVILADRGSWSGASGSWDGSVVDPGSLHPTHSSGKTFVGAQILRLVEDGIIGLDDLASGLLPPELAFYDANGATIREVLAMRSGIPSLNGEVYYPGEQAVDVVDVFKQLPESSVPAGSMTEYASTNFVLLGAIIQNATGHTLSEALQSDVLAHPGLEGIVYTVDDALASDGLGVEATPASLARWGYDLYGGAVISKASLDEMTDFGGSWYGLGVMDFSNEYRTFAIGHQGLSSPATCCSAIILVAFPEEGLVIAVQANTTGTTSSNDDVDRLAGRLREVIKG